MWVQTHDRVGEGGEARRERQGGGDQSDSLRVLRRSCTTRIGTRSSKARFLWDGHSPGNCNQLQSHSRQIRAPFAAKKIAAALELAQLVSCVFFSDRLSISFRSMIIWGSQHPQRNPPMRSSFPKKCTANV